MVRECDLCVQVVIVEPLTRPPCSMEEVEAHILAIVKVAIETSPIPQNAQLFSTSLKG